MHRIEGELRRYCNIYILISLTLRGHFIPANAKQTMSHGEIFTRQFGHVITSDISSDASRASTDTALDTTAGLYNPTPCLIFVEIFYANDATLAFPYFR